MRLVNIYLILIGIVHVNVNSQWRQARAVPTLNFYETQSFILKEASRQDSLESILNSGWPSSTHFGCGAAFLFLGFGFTMSTDGLKKNDPMVLPLIGAGIGFGLVGIYEVGMGLKKKQLEEAALENQKR